MVADIRYLQGQPEAFEARVGREKHKFTIWQCEVRNLNGSQWETVEARARGQQVLECALIRQKEATRELLPCVMQDTHDAILMRRVAPQELAHARNEVREMAQQASVQIAGRDSRLAEASSALQHWEATAQVRAAECRLQDIAESRSQTTTQY